MSSRLDTRCFSATALAIACTTTLLLCTARPVRADEVTQVASFTNPILFADYSDPDVIRDGDAYYMVASTFHFVPGIPILKSTDLVHWTIVGHVVQRMKMDPRYELTGGDRYGKGIWAPAIRKHDGLFYVYFPTPDEGIFVSTAKQITGPWSEPVAVMAQAGLEDPCPFWDEDGSAYLVHSKVGAGPLILHRMSPDGMRVLDEGKVIAEDRERMPILEGPKVYKRNGFYYIFAPIGGVSTGSQAVLRSRSIDGPYEFRVVLAQGPTPINGPHQGGYVETPDGSGWFVHFQSRGAHGRIVHLQPVRWQNDWPVMGEAKEGAITGKPVRSWAVPVASRSQDNVRPQTSDEFSDATLGHQWEWNHNPVDANWSLTARRGYMQLRPLPAQDLVTARNTLTQCMQDHAFEFTVRLDLSSMADGTHAGLAMFERRASGVEVVQAGSERRLRFFHVDNQAPEPVVSAKAVVLRVNVEGDRATYAYSVDEAKTFATLGNAAPLAFGWWKGSRPAVFAYTTGATTAGAVDVDWARYRATAPNPW